MFNESIVATRIIEAASRIDWPRNKLRIQVLDDSTDESADIARHCCERLRDTGVPIQYLHRENRIGYKAGALAAGLAEDGSEFVVIFDADFIPPVNFLHETIHHFTDERIGVVQSEWSHLNRSDSILTECQAMFLDGHFVIEQTARCRNNRWFNFNGTAGVWRRSCIEDAGGWEHDTLTEDADLSYRAQMRGWQFVYLPQVHCAAELPPTVSAFLSQQHRWNKGLIQCAIKLMPRIILSDASWKVKLEAWFHLTSPVVYVAMVVLILLAYPAYVIRPATNDPAFITAVVLGTCMLCFGTIAASLFYVVAQKSVGLRVRDAILYLPMLMAVGIGMSVVNTRGVLEALAGIKSPFVRTPKFNRATQSDADPAGKSKRWWARLWPRGLMELILGVVAIVCYVMSFSREAFALIGAPFLILFAAGYLAIGIPMILKSLGIRR